MPPQLIHMHTRPSVVPISSQNSDETIFEMFLCNLDSQHTQSCQSHGMQMGRPRDWFELILIAFRFPILSRSGYLVWELHLPLRRIRDDCVTMGDTHTA